MCMRACAYVRVCMRERVVCVSVYVTAEIRTPRFVTLVAFFDSKPSLLCPLRYLFRIMIAITYPEINQIRGKTLSYKNDAGSFRTIRKVFLEN